MKKITLLMLFLSIIAAKAQWTTDYAVNTSLSTNRISGPISKSTTDGKTFVTFWTQRDSPVNYQMYVQLFDKDGNKLFGNDGLLVHDNLNMSTFTTIYSTTVDKDNNLYIGFNQTGGTGDGFVHKISPTGVQLWGAEGLSLGANIFDVKIFADPNSSNVYISSFPQSGLAIVGKYDSAKQLLWQNTQAIAAPTNYVATSVGEGAVLSDGSLVALFHARANPGVPDSNFFAQRFNSSNGNTMWSSPVKLSTWITAFNTRYSTVTSNDILYLGFTGASSTRFDSFLQRIDADGTLPWGNNGKDFSTTNTYYELNTRIAMQEGSSDIWATSRFTTTSQGSSGMYVQKFDKNTGAVAFTSGAKEVFSVDSNYKYQVGNLMLNNDKPVFVNIKADYNGANSTPISIAALNTDGSLLFPNKTIDIATSVTDKGYITFTGSGTNFVAAWMENRGGDFGFVQNFDFANYLATANVTKENQVKFYPNPVSSILNINSGNKIEEVKVYNVTGQELKSEKTDKIDFSRFPKGMYIISVKDSKGNVSSEKIIKK